MEQELFVELNREGQKLPGDVKNPIHEYQSHAGCTLEEALARTGFKLDSYISGGLFNFCRLYVRGKKSSSGETSTFCDGYIDASFHVTDEEGLPLHHYIYVGDFFTWVKVVGMLSTSGGRIHGRGYHGSED